MNFNHFIPILLLLIIIKVQYTISQGLYNTCNHSFSCGPISDIKYPFRRLQDPPQCGYPGFELNCDQQNIPTINITNITYRVLGIDPTTQILKLVRGDMINSCPQNLVNTTINHELFDYTPSYMNISFLIGCPMPFDVVGMIDSVLCSNIGMSPVILVPGAQGPGMCETSVVIPSPVGFNGLVRVLQDGFEVKWKVESGPCTKCIRSGGLCVYDVSRLATTCACPEPPYLADSCSRVDKTNVGLSPPSSSSSSPSSDVVRKLDQNWTRLVDALGKEFSLKWYVTSEESDQCKSFIIWGGSCGVNSNNNGPSLGVCDK